jgi:hypothetical protein|tara:strand:+ start:1398 stop:2183 length:786 start_codon:yes stop_codon:yes gene_type:complete
MNEEKDVTQVEEVQETQTSGLMAEESKTMESEETDGEGINTHQDESIGTEEESEGEVYERPDWFPEKFWHEKDGPNIENMAKSLNSLEKKLGETAPDQYDLSEVQVDPEDPVVKAVLDFGKEKQLSNKSITGLINSVIEITGGVQEQEQINIEKEKEKLGEHATQIIQSNINWGQKLVKQGTLTPEDYAELEVLGGTANGQRLIQKLRQMQGEKEIPTVSIPGTSFDKNELQAMVADPKYQSDPIYRKKVERAFEEAYGAV